MGWIGWYFLYSYRAPRVNSLTISLAQIDRLDGQIAALDGATGVI